MQKLAVLVRRRGGRLVLGRFLEGRAAGRRVRDAHRRVGRAADQTETVGGEGVERALQMLVGQIETAGVAVGVHVPVPVLVQVLPEHLAADPRESVDDNPLDTAEVHVRRRAARLRAAQRAVIGDGDRVVELVGRLPQSTLQSTQPPILGFGDQLEVIRV